MVVYRLTEQLAWVQASPKKDYFVPFKFLLLLQETDGLLQITIGAICAFPEQNHIVAFKVLKKSQFSKMTSVAQW